MQPDAIQNITASIKSYIHFDFADGAFQSVTGSGNNTANVYNPATDSGLNFDASRVVRTSDEDRPLNASIKIWKRIA